MPTREATPRTVRRPRALLLIALLTALTLCLPATAFAATEESRSCSLSVNGRTTESCEELDAYLEGRAGDPGSDADAGSLLDRLLAQLQEFLASAFGGDDDAVPAADTWESEDTDTPEDGDGGMPGGSGTPDDDEMTPGYEGTPDDEETVPGEDTAPGDDGASDDGGMPGEPEDEGTPAGGGAGDCGMTSYEQEVFDLANGARQDEGLDALACDPELVAGARAWSERMVNGNFFEHDTSGNFGENIIRGYDGPQAVHQGWMSSPGHRSNILGRNYQEMGVGCYRSDCTQRFR
jgi:hypothetical protein